MIGSSDAEKRPSFLITIDTEGDNLWAKPHTITTKNARFLPRFQALCERYGLKPTYLVNWEMSQCPQFREFGRSVLAAATGELGMHLHGWNSPPMVKLTGDDDTCQPYLVEYPPRQMRDKVNRMTDTLEDAFNVKIVSHRSGRWSFNEEYARILLERGYRIDCSVTPNVSWRWNCDGARGRGGNDYSGFPSHAYVIDLADIRRGRTLPATGPCLLEVPMTILPPRRWQLLGPVAEALRHSAWGSSLAYKLCGIPRWLRPHGNDRQTLLDILAIARCEGRDYVEFMLHSSEFMPGGSPTFPTERSIELLYEDLEALFSVAAATFRGCTLSEYAEKFFERCRQPAAVSKQTTASSR